MKITLVRHGQTEENYQNIIQGRSRNELNEEGIRQCQKLREKLKDVSFQFCYMSPILRTVQTAFILVGDRVETFPDSRLIERNMGELEGESRDSYDTIKYWNYDLNSSDLGVESVQEMFQRCQNFLDYVVNKHKGEHILVVTHAAILRVLRHLLLHHKLNGNLLDIDIYNCYCETFEIKEG